jgi:hypothetical protein
LERGFAQDIVTVHRWSVGEDVAFCEVSVAPGPDGANPFHLSAITSHRIVAQLAIDSLCVRAGQSKSELGEVYEIEHAVRYTRKIAKHSEIAVHIRAVKQRRIGSLIATTFDYDVGGGCFQGSVELGFAPKRPTARGKLVSENSVESYRDHYFSYYGDAAAEAKANAAVYQPKACIRFEPDPGLATELRELASDIADCIKALHDDYLRCRVGGSSVSDLVPVTARPPLPTLVRLDVVEGPEGCRVVEINSGNCGGVETSSRMHTFLHQKCEWPNRAPLLLTRFVEALELHQRSAVEFVYIDDQSKFLSLVRGSLFRNSVKGLTCRMTPLAEFVSRRGAILADTLVYRDFLYEELAELGPTGLEAQKLFLALPASAYFPSFSDEYLSDKHAIAAIDQDVRLSRHPVIRDGLASKWLRRMLPSVPVTPTAVPGTLPFPRPTGLVVKPADGYGGHGVTILERGTLPSDSSFYRGHALWVAQPFADTPLYEVERAGHGPKHVRLVHGVFLLRVGQTLGYAGTFSRLSPQKVVNIKNDGDVVFFVEPRD